MEQQVGSIQTVVVQSMSHPAILGHDQLFKGAAVIDYDTKTMIWHNVTFNLEMEGDQTGIASFGSTPPIMEGDVVAATVRANENLFAAKSEPTGRYPLIEVRIDTGDHRPIRQRAYRAALTKRQVIEKEVNEMLEAGIIRPSSSPWASPVTLVPKKSGEIRFCVDYRKLNNITKKDSYPLPLIQDIFDQLGGATIFSTMDLKSGYWQIPVAEEDIEKTAFTCHLGLFEFTRLPFGLANAPAVFQRTMNKVLSGLIGKCCMVYLDDIVVYSQDEDSHANDLAAVFDRLRQAGLALKPSKCAFGLESVELLGYIINKDGIKMNPEKVKAIQELSVPRDVKEVRSFLGMAGYYRQCIPHYAHEAEPLTRLTQKKVKFEWGPEQQRAFETLRKLLTSDAVMAHPKTDKPYRLYTDACDYAIGAILVQTDNNGVERVVQYLSHQLAGAQRRWATIEKEAYAVVYAIEKLRPYLYGSTFTVLTDHKPLASLFTKQMNNTKIQRWAVLLAEYGAKIEYRKGTNNIRADMLSRIRPPLNEIGVLDTKEWANAGFPEDEIQEGIPLEYDGLDAEAIRKEQISELPAEYEEAMNPESDYELHKGLLYSTLRPSKYAADYPRLVLPPSARAKVIARAHKEVGHMGALKTLERVREAYVWPGMKAAIQERVRNCPTCSVHVRRKEHVPMGEMPIANYPMQIVGADLIGPLMKSDNGNTYALTMVDHATGWAEVYPLPSKSNKPIWDSMANDFFPRHGYPEVLITDNGMEFNSQSFRQYLKGVGVHHQRTTPYHPQSNGKTERFNRTLKEMLARLVNNNRANWENQLSNALTAYRNAVSTTTGHTPFHLLYGRRARLPLTTMLKPVTSTEPQPFGTRLDDLSKCLQEAKAMTEQSRVHNRNRLQDKANAQNIEVGDTVIVAANEPMTLTAKWDHQWEVTRVRGMTCWLRHQLSGKTRVVHREKLRLVDPEAAWDEVKQRPVRNSRVSTRAVAPNWLLECEQSEEPEEVVTELSSPRDTPSTGQIQSEEIPGKPSGPIQEREPLTLTLKRQPQGQRVTRQSAYGIWSSVPARRTATSPVRPEPREQKRLRRSARLKGPPNPQRRTATSPIRPPPREEKRARIEVP